MLSLELELELAIDRSRANSCSTSLISVRTRGATDSLRSTSTTISSEFVGVREAAEIAHHQFVVNDRKVRLGHLFQRTVVLVRCEKRNPHFRNGTAKRREAGRIVSLFSHRR